MRAARVRTAALAAAVALASGACSGPSVHLGLFVREEKANLILTKGTTPEDAPPPARPPGAEPFNPGFPGFVAPPPPLVHAPSSGDGPDTALELDDALPPPKPVVPCPRPTADQPPDQIATSSVAGPPAPGDYTFRRTGTATVDGTTVSLDGTVVRRIENVATTKAAGQVRWRYDSVQDESNAVTAFGGKAAVAQTRTTYEIDPNATAEIPNQPEGDAAETAGLKIVSVTTKSSAGTDSFAPQPPVRLMMLPATVKGYDEHGQGTDPLTGLHMDTTFRTFERAEVEGCGVTYQAWRQRVQGKYYDAEGAAGAPGHTVWFVSTLYVATQYGAMVLADDVHLSDTAPLDPAAAEWVLPTGRALDVRSTTTINSITPRPPA